MSRFVIHRTSVWSLPQWVRAVQGTLRPRLEIWQVVIQALCSRGQLKKGNTDRCQCIDAIVPRQPWLMSSITYFEDKINGVRFECLKRTYLSPRCKVAARPNKMSSLNKNLQVGIWPGLCDDQKNVNLVITENTIRCTHKSVILFSLESWSIVELWFNNWIPLNLWIMKYEQEVHISMLKEFDTFSTCHVFCSLQAFSRVGKTLLALKARMVSGLQKKCKFLETLQFYHQSIPGAQLFTASY